MTNEEFRQRRVAMGISRHIMANLAQCSLKKLIGFELGHDVLSGRQLSRAKAILKPSVDLEEIYRAVAFLLFHVARQRNAVTRNRLFSRIKTKNMVKPEAFVDVVLKMMFSDIIKAIPGNQGHEIITLGEKGKALLDERRYQLSEEAWQRRRASYRERREQRRQEKARLISEAGRTSTERNLSPEN